MELKATSQNESISSTPAPLPATTTVGAAAIDNAPVTLIRGGARKYLRAVGDGLSLSGLRPCTTYRLTLEVPPVVRNDLLESARYAVESCCRMRRETRRGIAVCRARSISFERLRWWHALSPRAP